MLLGRNRSCQDFKEMGLYQKDVSLYSRVCSRQGQQPNPTVGRLFRNVQQVAVSILGRSLMGALTHRKYGYHHRERLKKWLPFLTTERMHSTVAGLASTSLFRLHGVRKDIATVHLSVAAQTISTRALDSFYEKVQ